MEARKKDVLNKLESTLLQIESEISRIHVDVREASKSVSLLPSEPPPVAGLEVLLRTFASPQSQAAIRMLKRSERRALLSRFWAVHPLNLEHLRAVSTDWAKQVVCAVYSRRNWSSEPALEERAFFVTTAFVETNLFEREETTTLWSILSREDFADQLFKILQSMMPKDANWTSYRSAKMIRSGTDMASWLDLCFLENQVHASPPEAPRCIKEAEDRVCRTQHWTDPYGSMSHFNRAAPLFRAVFAALEDSNATSGDSLWTFLWPRVESMILPMSLGDPRFNGNRTHWEALKKCYPRAVEKVIQTLNETDTRQFFEWLNIDDDRRSYWKRKLKLMEGVIFVIDQREKSRVERILGGNAEARSAVGRAKLFGGRSERSAMIFIFPTFVAVEFSSNGQACLAISRREFDDYLKSKFSESNLEFESSDKLRIFMRDKFGSEHRLVHNGDWQNSFELHFQYHFSFRSRR